jgi:PPK2 family polyphosphate:nucleotide phosphotransferase
MARPPLRRLLVHTVAVAEKHKPKRKSNRRQDTPAEQAAAGGTDAWRAWQLAAPQAKFSLSDFDPSAKPFSTGDKAADRARVDELAVELDELQNLFYADGRYKLLVILQGIDTSGKDGTLRAVFSRMSPIGLRTAAWGAPNEAERAHDFLWRIHQQVPGRGEIVLFNRSHYEDVLVPVLSGDIDAAETGRRYAQINDFERLLSESGTVVLKFLLLISKDEQRERLQERIDDPAKRWKFQRGDLDVRRGWDAYHEAFSRAVAATATSWAPWTIVPADSKTHRNLMVALAVRHALQALDLHYRDDDPTIRGVKVE